jgi:hypothetical protein
MICSDPKVVQKLHNNFLTTNMTGYGYKYYERTVNKPRWNETLQIKTMKTTKGLHGFHHTK